MVEGADGTDGVARLTDEDTDSHKAPLIYRATREAPFLGPSGALPHSHMLGCECPVAALLGLPARETVGWKGRLWKIHKRKQERRLYQEGKAGDFPDRIADAALLRRLERHDEGKMILRHCRFLED